ncbi:MAG: hypothetical protein JWM57_2529 [Phycisphaerales bacterium]|nr:hypothetical protein [Phycisphaerales bacterium]
MSLADQLQVQFQSIVSSVASFEQAAAAQGLQVQSLTTQVAALTAENVALRNRIGTTAEPGGEAGDDGDGSAPAVTQWGFAANETDPLAGLKVALPRMKADGGNWLRLWHSSFGPISAATARLIDLAAAAGVSVILCVQPKDTSPYSLGVPDFTAFASQNAAVLKKVAFVEAGNELNLAQYRPDDLGVDAAWPAAYVRRWLKPLSVALDAISVKTMCACVTETEHSERYVPQYAALLAAGAGDWCAAVALHAYVRPEALAAIGDVVTALRQTWKKPVHVTECNVYTRGLSQADWAKQFPPYLAMLKSAGAASACFYRGFAKTSGKWNWPILFDAAGVPAAAYSLVTAEMKK